MKLALLVVVSWPAPARWRPPHHGPPIRTGPASRSRSANCRSHRSGPGRRSIPRRPIGSRTRRWPLWSGPSPSGGCRWTRPSERIAAFAKATDKQRTLPLLFAGVFDVLNRERETVMGGLDRFGAAPEGAGGKPAARGRGPSRGSDRDAAGRREGRRSDATCAVGSAVFRNAAAVPELCLRCSDNDRATAVRPGEGDPGQL